ncbi:MAG: HEPN domain-containing protein [Candidatus Desulforudis sp.]|nr:HEPN domain-containing protein [Desulforudis sp.]
MVEDLILHRLRKAEGAFTDAEMLFERGRYGSAVNRYYYAVFHAIRALLATKDLDSPKHSGVISLFNKEFVKNGLMSKKSSKTITKLFNMRSEADYGDFVYFEKHSVEAVRGDARSLIGEISVFLSKEWLS